MQGKIPPPGASFGQIVALYTIFVHILTEARFGLRSSSRTQGDRHGERDCRASGLKARATAGRLSPKHNVDAVREAYYERISKFDMAPLWKVMKSVVTKEPVTRCAPVIWHYDDVKSLVMESGGLISAEEAQRRVLVLENPAMRGESRATNTLFAGIQMILPGEVAPVHRHVSSAIRFVLDGEGAYTAVEGEKAFMSPGDFVITANWAPHDHGNPSKKPMLWLDVLDFPAVNFYEASFADYCDEGDAGHHPAGWRFADLLRLRRAARRRPGRASTAARSSTTPMRARARSSSA